MKVDVKPEVVQHMLRTWKTRLIDQAYGLVLFCCIPADKHTPEQRREMFVESSKLNSSGFILFWLEFLSQKKIEVLAQEAVDCTFLPIWIEEDAVMNRWLQWLKGLITLAPWDEKNSIILAKKCYFTGLHLGLLAKTEEMEIRELQNIESVYFQLIKTSSIFVKVYASKVVRTVSAKHSASHKTKKVDVDRAIVKAIYEKWGQKNCSAFRAEAMVATGKTERTVQTRLKELMEEQ